MRCKSFSLRFQTGSNPTLLCSEGTFFCLDTVRLLEVRNRLTANQSTTAFFVGSWQSGARVERQILETQLRRAVPDSVAQYSRSAATLNFI